MSSRHHVLSIVLFAVFACTSTAAPIQTGCTFLAGICYDDLRMCIATPAGVKGGPIGDIMVALHFPLDEKSSLGLKIPVMRPILFGAAFKMLQFEPEITLEYKPSGRIGERVFIESGIGGSFHWGPDYTTARDAKVRDNFFAAGPMLCSLFAFRFPAGNGIKRYVGLKLFYAALYSKERPKGTVFGTAIEGGIDLFQL